MNMENERQFYNYFPQGDRSSGIIKEIKKEIGKIEEISDMEERFSLTNSCWIKHRENLNSLTKCLNSLHLERINIDKASTTDEYSKQIDKLEKMWNKFSDEVSEKEKEQQEKEYQLKASHCSYCKSKPSAEHYIYSEKNKELKQRKRNAYSYKKEYLFCSENHFEKWHKKNYFTCSECSEQEK